MLGASLAVKDFLLLVTLLSYFGVLSSVSEVYAQEADSGTDIGEFTKYDGTDEIKNSPEAQKILDKIEESKRILNEMMEKQQPIVTEHEKFIEEQRKIAKDLLESELDSMRKNYEEFTPRNAFAKFVSGINSTHQQIYWDQFNYMEEKIKLAKAAKQQVLDNGGTFGEAHRAYVKYASMPRVEMISLIQELNVKHGFADPEMQELFDKYGKLPRYENEITPCYACEKFEPIRDALMEKTDEVNSVGGKNKIESSSSVNFVTFEDANKLDKRKTTQDTSSENIDRDKLDSAIGKLEQKIDDLTEELLVENDEQRQKELMASIERAAQIIRDLKQL